MVIAAVVLALFTDVLALFVDVLAVADVARLVDVPVALAVALVVLALFTDMLALFVDVLAVADVTRLVDVLTALAVEPVEALETLTDVVYVIVLQIHEPYELVVTALLAVAVLLAVDAKLIVLEGDDVTTEVAAVDVVEGAIVVVTVEAVVTVVPFIEK